MSIGGGLLNTDLDGLITEFGTWDRALTSLEVASLYNQGMPTNLLVNRNNYQSGNPTVFNTKQVDFDGTDDQLKVTNNYGSLTGSVSFWINRDNNTGYQYLFDARGSGSGTGFAYFDTGTDNLIVSSGTRYVDGVAATSVATDGNWHHVIITGVTLDVDESIRYGTDYGIGNAFEGKMSQIGLWNSTLTADEVSSLYNHGLPIDLTTDQAAYESSSNLVGYWRMGSGTLDSYPLIADQTNATLGGDLVNTIENDSTYAFPTFIDNGGGSYTMATTTTDYAGFEQPDADTFAVVVGEIYKLTFDYVLNSGALDLELFIGSSAVGSSYGNKHTCQVGFNTVFITISTSNSAARLVSQINQVSNMTISNIVLKKGQPCNNDKPNIK
jgi:hypothetical protein